MMPAESCAPLPTEKPGPNETRFPASRVTFPGAAIWKLVPALRVSQAPKVVVVVTVDIQTGKVLTGPEIITRGFIPEDDSEELLRDAKKLVCAMLAEHSREAIGDWEELRVEVRKTLRRFFNKSMDRRPLILPVIMEL